MYMNLTASACVRSTSTSCLLTLAAEIPLPVRYHECLCSIQRTPADSISLQGEGDVVTATAIPGKPGLVVIESVTGDDGRLPLAPDQNCVGIAALEALEMIAAQHGRPACGVALRLEKVRAGHLRCPSGMPMG